MNSDNKSSRREKIAYFSPVDWNWIKQRPQFLAEELSSYYSLSVLYPWRNQRKGLQKTEITGIHPTPYFSCPTLGGKLRAITSFNKKLACAQIKRWLKKTCPDYLWLSMPWQIELIPANIDCPIIYDCMDDYAAITMHKDSRDEILRQEEKLTAHADYIFVSSQNLCRLLCERYGCAEKLTLLRNGYNAAWGLGGARRRESDKPLRIGYYGTIGRWFDFRLVLDSLKEFDDIEYHLFGPSEPGVTVPNHSRIIAHGVVQHKEIPTRAVELDALVMPFVPNEIVQSVDPVKLYEYICLNRRIICIQYPEIERFGPFVHFYSSEEEYFERLREALSGNEMKFSRSQADSFLADNSWRNRAELVYKTLSYKKREKK